MCPLICTSFMAEKIASELAEAISLIECEFLTEFLIRDSSITAAPSFGMTAWECEKEKYVL